MPAPFKRLTVPEFALLLERFPFTRRVTSVHMHHTWRPNHAQFRGHDSIVAMWRFHTQERHFSDIAQHLTIDPQGVLWTGRNWNASPASASGFNGNAEHGPFMFEIVGDFDRGMDLLEGAQRAAVLDVIKLVQLKFGLEPETLMFHNQMAKKSCPGTDIDRAAWVALVREHRPSTEGATREAPSGPFGSSISRAMNETIMRATDLLTVGGARAVDAADAADAELDYDDERCAATMRDAAREQETDLSPEEIEQLRPHVVNLRMGMFSTDGKMTTTEGDVDAIFDTHLRKWVDARKTEDRPAHIMLFAHGGLVKESSGLAIALKSRNWWMRNGVYPIYFVWETGLFETIGDLLGKIRGRAVPEGARDIFDWTSDPLIEEAARALQAPRIWGVMKASAMAASSDGGGAHYVARRLGEFAKSHGDKLRLHAVGHSAGSIFHAYFLPACRAENADFASLQLLAPAVTCTDFKAYLSAMGGGIPHTTIFTMNRSLERADNCAQVYRKSLLYLVSEACELRRKTPILGLEDSLRDDKDLRAFFGLRAPSDTGSVVWSKSPSDTGCSATRSTSHGGFDDDGPTMGSVLRRIRGLDDADPIDPFPTSGTSRDAARDWTAEVDWPAPFDRAWVSAPLPPRGATVSATAQAPYSSQGKGRRVALCVGINAYPTAPLNGCVADAKKWKATFERLGFETTLLTDGEATRERIIDALRGLITSSHAGDSIAFQYSGHGTQVDDINGDEAAGDTPGLDEALCPHDFASGHFLIDDDIAELIEKLPACVKLSFLLDCCHSGTGTRFAVRASLDPAPADDARVRYIVPTAEMQEAHRRFRSSLNASRVPRATEMREVTFAACRSREVAWESKGQGDFTRCAHEVIGRGVDGITNVGFHEAVLRAFGSSARQQPQLECDVAVRAGPWLGL